MLEKYSRRGGVIMKAINISEIAWCQSCGDIIKGDQVHIYCDDPHCETCLDYELNQLATELDKGEK